ncbi:MAG TPA: V-type ATP synthase subunit E [Clostridium sp.]
MTTIEDKISLFSKIIHDKVNEEKKERLATFNFQAEKRISMQKEQIEKLRHSLQREADKKADIKANGIVAKEKINKQREVLFLKDKLIKDAVECVRERLVEFVRSPQYKSYFINNLRKTLKEIAKGHYYIILLKRDYEKYQGEVGVILKDYIDHNIEIKISEGDFIGGHILKDYEGKFRIDDSIYSALQESKEIIGVRVMEMLS